MIALALPAGPPHGRLVLVTLLEALPLRPFTREATDARHALLEKLRAADAAVALTPDELGAIELAVEAFMLSRVPASTWAVVKAVLTAEAAIAARENDDER